VTLTMHDIHDTRREGHRLKGVSGLGFVLPAPVDYVPWTERVATVSKRAEFKAHERTAWVSGRMSRRADKEFTAEVWRVYESYSNAAER
jgi:hypothetical protein